MTVAEFTAAIEGLRESLGMDATPISWDDFSHLEHRKGPTGSIRDDGP